jgi:predicted DNA-binding transcriptional regulator AlpA
MVKELEKTLMNVQEPTRKAALSVVEVASLCLLSPSRFHALVRQGVFPKAVKAGQGRRPHYTHELVQRCVEIRSTGIGENGQITLFNRPPKKKADRKRATITPAVSAHEALIDALQGLGLSATDEAVAAAVRNVFPTGTSSVEDSEIIRKVFLFLKGNRK